MSVAGAAQLGGDVRGRPPVDVVRAQAPRPTACSSTNAAVAANHIRCRGVGRSSSHDSRGRRRSTARSVLPSRTSTRRQAATVVRGPRVVLGQVPRPPERRDRSVDVAAVEPQLGVDRQARLRLVAAGELAGDHRGHELEGPGRVARQHEPGLLAQLAGLAVAAAVARLGQPGGQLALGRSRRRRRPARAGRGPRAPAAGGSRRRGRPARRRRWRPRGRRGRPPAGPR